MSAPDKVIAVDLSGELARAGNELHTARARLRAATAKAQAVAYAARLGGLSEVKIAAALRVGRNTVREWLGKPRQR